MTKDDRLEIKLRLIEQLVENPNFEATSVDMEYWEPLHDKLKNKLATCEALARAVMMDQTSHDGGALFMTRDEIDTMWQQALRRSAFSRFEIFTRYHFAELLEAKVRKECAELCRAEANGRSPLAFDALHECADLFLEGYEK